MNWELQCCKEEHNPFYNFTWWTAEVKIDGCTFVGHGPDKYEALWDLAKILP